MSFFREQCGRDIAAAFLNPAEFGEEIVIDGERRLAVIDDGQGGFLAGAAGGFDNASGIGLVANARTLYLADTLAARPVPGQMCLINGEQWQVEDDPASVKIEMGLLVLRLLRVWS